MAARLRHPVATIAEHRTLPRRRALVDPSPYPAIPPVPEKLIAEVTAALTGSVMTHFTSDVEVALDALSLEVRARQLPPEVMVFALKRAFRRGERWRGRSELDWERRYLAALGYCLITFFDEKH